jgi:hypothetical protein
MTIKETNNIYIWILLPIKNISTKNYKHEYKLIKLDKYKLIKVNDLKNIINKYLLLENNKHKIFINKIIIKNINSVDENTIRRNKNWNDNKDYLLLNNIKISIIDYSVIYKKRKFKYLNFFKNITKYYN